MALLALLEGLRLRGGTQWSIFTQDDPYPGEACHLRGATRSLLPVPLRLLAEPRSVSFSPSMNPTPSLSPAPLGEEDTRTRLVWPALKAAGWHDEAVRQEVVIAPGRIEAPDGVYRRSPPMRADFLLRQDDAYNLGVIEAKKESLPAVTGLEQAREAARRLGAPAAIATNGRAFVWEDMTGLLPNHNVGERSLDSEQFPTREFLWNLYCQWRGLGGSSSEAAKIVSSAQYDWPSDQAQMPRPYQLEAINRVIEGIVAGKRRLLLVMATGTGKTYTAYQIAYRARQVFTSKGRPCPRILYLADRKILITDPMRRDFSGFASFMHRIGSEKYPDGRIPAQYEVYFGLYQGLDTGAAVEDREDGAGGEDDRDLQSLYKSLKPDFFDLVIVDECHRGSASEESKWREVLEYFSSAVHLGLTATPRADSEVKSEDYFGAPVYTYSLRQGISDGYLAPFVVYQHKLDKDQAWRPETGQTADDGRVIPDKVYDRRNWDRNIILPERHRKVAQIVTSHLHRIGRDSRTIVFCQNIAHAAAMVNALRVENADLINQGRKNYVVQLTSGGGSGDERLMRDQLDRFIDPETGPDTPAIAVTSKLLTTGVDTKMCKLIVIDQSLESTIEFRQIIGRGTRVDEGRGKMAFDILDFRNTVRMFNHGDFGGEPIAVVEVEEDGTQRTTYHKGATVPNPGAVAPPTPPQNLMGAAAVPYKISGLMVHLNGVEQMYVDADGKVVRLPSRQQVQTMIRAIFPSPGDVEKAWGTAEGEAAIRALPEWTEVEHVLMAHGYGPDHRWEADTFDGLLTLGFGRRQTSRASRAEEARKRLTNLDLEGNTALIAEAAIEQYELGGWRTLINVAVLRLQTFQTRLSPSQVIATLGGHQGYHDLIARLRPLVFSR